MLFEVAGSLARVEVGNRKKQSLQIVDHSVDRIEHSACPSTRIRVEWLQRVEECDQIGFFLGGKSDVEALVIKVEHINQGGVPSHCESRVRGWQFLEGWGP